MITKKYYKLVRVSHADSDLFRITNVDTTAGTLTINAGNNLGKNLEYSTDGVNWTTADPNAPFSLTVASGANVYMRGTNGNMTQKSINMDVNHTIGGNLYSLTNKSNYASITSMTVQEAFFDLFLNDTHLISAEDLNFGNVTTVGDMCFLEMFKGCTAMTKAPSILPATSMGQRSYGYMFKNCTSLTVAPELPATSLSSECYENMFSGCSSLSYIKCLAESIGYNSLTSWVNGVAANGTFYKSANMSDWTTGTSGIPSGWTVVDA